MVPDLLLSGLQRAPAVQTYGGMGFSLEAPVSRLFRDARVMRTVPVSEELILSRLATRMLSLPGR